MIPASYLFKDVYRQTWLDPDIEAAIERHRAADKGQPIWTRLMRAIAALRLPNAVSHQDGTLAHE